MLSKLTGIAKDSYYGHYVQTLFDPVQTHAVYGVTEDTIATVKANLMKAGANRFRIIKNKFGFRIVCFSAKKISL